MRTIKLLATAFLEGAQGILETQKTPALPAWCRKDQRRLLEGGQAQGEEVASLAKGSVDRGGEGPGSRPKQTLLDQPCEAVITQIQESLLSWHLGASQWENGKKTPWRGLLVGVLTGG